MKHDDRDRLGPLVAGAFAGDNSASRRLSVAHPVHGVCAYCDDLYNRIRAAFKDELAPEIAEEVRSSHFMQAAALAAQIGEAGRNDRPDPR